MCEFKPGDEVVCVDDSVIDTRRAWLSPPKRTESYAVAEVFMFRGEPHVRLVELQNTGDIGYRARRFRKVQRRNLSEWLNTATKFEEPKRKKANA